MSGVQIEPWSLFGWVALIAVIVYYRWVKPDDDHDKYS